MKRYEIRDHDYYSGSIVVEYEDSLDYQDEFAEGVARLVWDAYQGGSVSIFIEEAEECEALANAFAEIAEMIRRRTRTIEEAGRRWREEQGFA